MVFFLTAATRETNPTGATPSGYRSTTHDHRFLALVVTVTPVVFDCPCIGRGGRKVSEKV
ncbi:hypothetical protein RchiOBHm_Chr5g0080251 [Rosa chinensis]|uniref:Uncharacterized protein n=1 Tax=Rosa chinensis TaxID=74649 RepID=A0A2P6QMR5_ROSCH|nr:hypothetical protein RchiOBHm_Chr5g0080251 [Rosa chinensis]